MGSVSVSSCRCCMFVSCVHPVAVLNAAFCMTCSLLMLVEDAIGDHTEEAYSRFGLITAYVMTFSISLQTTMGSIVNSKELKSILTSHQTHLGNRDIEYSGRLISGTVHWHAKQDSIILATNLSMLTNYTFSRSSCLVLTKP